MSAAKSIEIIANVNQGKKEFKKSTLLKNAQVYGAEADTSYLFVVDGRPGLPKGTKIVKRSNALAFELPDGRSFEIADWCLTNNSEVVELLNSQVYDQAADKWIDGVEAIISNSCAWVAQNGVTGLVGSTGAIAGSSEGISLLQGAMGLGLLAGLAGAAGGGSSGAAPVANTATPKVNGLTDGTNSGNLADQITSNNKPSISGKAAPGSKVTVTLQSGEVLETTANSAGDWVVNLTQALPDGQSTYQVVAQAPGASPSQAVAGSIVIDTTGPSTGIAVNQPTPGKGVTTANATLGGSGVGPDTTINVVLQKVNPDGTTTDILVGPVTVNPDGTWQIPTSIKDGLQDGSYTIKVTATDPAGNVSEDVESFTVDNTSPTTPIVALDPSSDGGIANDNVTNNKTPSIIGSGANPGDVITVTSPTGEVLTTVVAEDGTWKVTPTQELPEGGPQVFSVTATDPAGNASEATSFPITIDSVAGDGFSVSIAEGPAINSNESISDTGVPVKVTLASDAQIGDVINVSIDGSIPVSHTVTADDLLATSVTVLLPTSDVVSASTGQGPAVVTTTYTDAAGNKAPNKTTALTIDTAAPTGPVAVVINEGPTVNIFEVGSDNGVPVSITLPTDAAVGDVITVSIAGSEPVAYTLLAADVATPGQTISILLPADDVNAAAGGNGPAVVTTTYTDSAGNTSTPITTDLFIDNEAPAEFSVAVPEGLVINAAETASDGGVPVEVTLPANAAVGDEITVSIDGSEPVRYVLTDDDVGSSHLPISILIPASYIGDAGEGAAEVTTTYTDVAGNASAPVTTQLTIDTQVSAPALFVPEGLDINAAEAVNDAGVPVKVTLPTDAKAGDVIAVSIDGSTPVNHVVTAQDVAAIGVPINVLIPTAAILSASTGEGSALVTVNYTDGAGNTATGTSNLTIDTVEVGAPTVSILADQDQDGFITASGLDGFSQSATLVTAQIDFPTTGELATAGDSVVVRDNNGNTRTIILSDTDIQNGFALVTFPKPNEDATITVTASIIDTAGNESNIGVDAATMNLLPPGTPTISIGMDANNDGYINAGEKTSQPTTSVTVNLPPLPGPGDTYQATQVGDEITLFAADGVTVLGTHTVDLNDLAAGNYNFAGIALPVEGEAFGVKARLTNPTGPTNDAGWQALTPGNDTATIDTTAPTVAISVPSNALNIASPSVTVTFTLSEASTDFTLADISVLGTAGTLSNLQGSGTNYTATFTASPNSTGSVSLVVDSAKFSDVAQNNNSAASNTVVLDVDTAAPAAVWFSLPEAIGNPTNPASLNADESVNGGGMTVKVTPPADAAVGDVVTVSIDGGVPVVYTLTANDVSSPGKTLFLVVPTADVQAAGQGDAVVTTTFTDKAGNPGPSMSRSFIIDTVAPVSPQVGIPEGSTISAAESTSNGGVPVSVTLPADAAVGDFITVNIDGSNPVFHFVTAADVAAIGTPITLLLPTGDVLAAGQGPAVVTTTYTDAAGNKAPDVTTNITLDTSAPTAPTVIVAEGPSFNAAEIASDGGIPVAITLPANAAVGDVISVSIDGSAPVSYTVTAANVAAIATPISILIPTADVVAAGQGAAAITTTYTDSDGNAAPSTITNFTIDTQAPSSPTAAVAEGPIIGAAETTSNGGVPVQVTLPANAQAGDVITVSIDGSAPVSYTVTGANISSIGTPVNILIPTADVLAATEGAAVVTTTYADNAGNLAPSITTSLTIDTVAPSSPSATISEGPVVSTSEANSGGGVAVAVTLPANAAVGDVITVSIDNSTPVSYTVTAANVAAPGTPVSITLPTTDVLAAGQGAAIVTTTYTDNAGNSAPSITSSISIDTSPPSSPTVSVVEGPAINAVERVNGGGVPVEVTLPTNAAAGDVITVSISGSSPVSYTVTAANIAAPGTPVTLVIPAADISVANQGPAVITTTYVDNVGNAAPNVTTNVTIDTIAATPPTVSIVEGPVINGADSTSGAGVPVSVTLPSTAAEGDVVSVSINGSTPVNYTVTAADVLALATPVNVLIPTADVLAAGQGSAVVTTSYVDKAGNPSTNVTSNLTIDTFAPLSPTVAITEGPSINAAEISSGGGVPVSVTLPSNAAVGDVITVSIDNSTPISYTVTAANVAALATPVNILVPSATVTAAGPGSAIVTTTYTDAAGNAAPSISTALTVDAVSPFAPAVTAPEGPMINAAETTSGSGVPIVVTLPTNAEVGDVISVSIDGSAPVNYTVNAADLASPNTPITVVLPSADILNAGQGAAVITTSYVDAAGNPASNVTSSVTVDTLAPLSRTISGTSEDVLGNINLAVLEDTSNSFSSGINSITVTSLPNQGTLYLAGGVTAVQLNQTLDATQLAGLQYRSDTNNATATSFQVTATDAAGNSANVTVSLPITAVADADPLTLLATSTAQVLPQSSVLNYTTFNQSLDLDRPAPGSSTAGFAQRTKVGTIVGAMDTTRVNGTTVEATSISVPAFTDTGMHKFTGLIYLTTGTYATSTNGVSVDETLVVRLGGKTTLEIETLNATPVTSNLVVTTAGYYTIDAYFMNFAGPGSLPVVHLTKDNGTPLALNDTNFKLFKDLADLQIKIDQAGASDLTDLQGTTDGVNGYYAPLTEGKGIPGDNIKLQSVTVSSADTDGSETNSLLLSAIPVGMTITGGSGNSFTASVGNQSVVVTNWDLTNLRIPTTLASAAATGNLILESISTEASNGNKATTQINIPYEISLNSRTYTGTNASDTSLVGANGANRMFGGGGADTVDGATGNDMLYGGSGGALRNGGFEYWNATAGSITAGSEFLYQILTSDTRAAGTGDTTLGGWSTGGAPSQGGSIQNSIELQASSYYGAQNVSGIGRFVLDGSTFSQTTDDLYLNQKVTTMSGQNYTLDVVLNDRGNNADVVEVMWGDVVIARIAGDASHTVTTYHGYAQPTVSILQSASGSNPAVLNYSFTVTGSRDDSGTNLGIGLDNFSQTLVSRQILSVSLKPTTGDGADTLIGGMGSDILFGQGGNDQLIGGVQGNASADRGSVDIAVLSFANDNGRDTFQDFQVGVDRIYLVDVSDAYIGSGNWNSSGNAAHVSRYPGNPGSTVTNSTSNSDNNLTIRDLIYANNDGTSSTAIGQNKQYLSINGNGSGDVVIHLNTNGGTAGATNDNMGSITLTGVKFGSNSGQYDSIADLLGHGGATRIVWGTTDGFKDPVSTMSFGDQTVQNFDWMNLININGIIIP
jgi:hypothetical protein